MDAVSGDVKNAVETTEYLFQSIINLWGILPDELKAFVLTMFIVSILMQWVKKAWLMSKPKKEKIRILWLVSFPAGMALAGLGWYMSENTIHNVYWAAIGLTVSTVAMGVHKLTTNYFLPLAGLVFGAVSDRLYIMVTGKARNKDV